MGFNGYWFNVSQKYNTNKYPHCYVGIIKKGGAAWGAFAKYNENIRPAWGAFAKYNENIRPAWGAFAKYNENIRPAWGAFGGEIVTHNVTNFVETEGGNFRVELEWHKLEGIPISNATPLYDASGHKMTNPNYVIDLYYKVIVPAVGKNAQDVFFTEAGGTNKWYKWTKLDLLGEEIKASKIFYTDHGCLGLIVGSNPVHGTMFLPNFSDITDIPVGTALGDLENAYWADGFNKLQGYKTAKFLNIKQSEGSSPNLLAGVSYTDTSITYTINPSFAACNIPITVENNNKYLLPELRTGFVLIDNTYIHKTDSNTPFSDIDLGALYMCLDIHAI